MRVRASQGAPKQIAELRQHRIGSRNVLVHHGRDSVQRVKKKVRLKLKLEILELRLRQARFELRGHDLPIAQLAIIVEEVERANEDGVDHHEVGEFHRVPPAHGAVVVASHSEEREDDGARNGHQRGVRNRENDGDAKVDWGNSPPRMLSEAEPAARPDNCGNQYGRG